MASTKEKSAVNKVIVIYPGRFQPMGKHHYDTYMELQSIYGDDTYIATSDKVDLPKSPLNFEEKKAIITAHGISPDKVVQVKNPYGAKEILKNFDPNTTSVIYAVGAKDMGENPRFKVGLTKKGTPTYYQDYEKTDKDKLLPYYKQAYLVVAPHVEHKIPGYGEMSGTTLRAVLSTADEDTFKKIMGIDNTELYEMMKNKFASSASKKRKRKKRTKKKKRKHMHKGKNSKYRNKGKTIRKFK